MDIERKLKVILDYQRFSPNVRLSKLTKATEARYGEAIPDERLEMVAAAGELGAQQMETDKAEHERTAKPPRAER